jgi:opacity protein-like surface antigen
VIRALIGLALLPFPAHSSGLYVSAGYDVRLRHHAYEVSAGWIHRTGLGAEVGFVSMGEQPDGYENINRFVTLNAVGYAKFTERVYGFAKAGIHTSEFSHNGTNDYDRSGDDLIGYQAMAGLETPLAKNLMLYGQAAVYSYRQVNNPKVGGTNRASIGLRYSF